ncbi:MAG: 3',5'-cyclic-nucleotide phosphodiesterase [Sulfuricella denitrificans]|nr:3',5'-cyclic-nucleotide phosphodiesterase [Sulfuricella denitrificans]
MKLRILGCSGGIGAGLRTTSMLLDGDILIDAGTGVGDLTLEEMARIDHVFLTHSHLDHVTSLPFLLDTVGAMRDRPVTVHALPETVAVLREHLFNWKLWPDFTQIPNAEQPFLRFAAMLTGQTVELDGRKMTALPARHVVPAAGYLLDSGAASLAFSGDTIDCPEFWHALNQVENLRYLIIETSFANEDNGIAHASRHYYPSLLAEQLPSLQKQAEVFITHLGPGDQPRIMAEILSGVHGAPPRMLAHGQLFEF